MPPVRIRGNLDKSLQIIWVLGDYKRDTNIKLRKGRSELFFATSQHFLLRLFVIIL